MIKVNKSNVPPILISSNGVAQKINDMIDFLADPFPFVNKINGARKKKFNKDVYGHSTVKNQLKVDQHQKCCYCESKFRTNSPVDV